jgi:hypothetical protein
MSLRLPLSALTEVTTRSAVPARGSLSNDTSPMPPAAFALSASRVRLPLAFSCQLMRRRLPSPVRQAVTKSVLLTATILMAVAVPA